jgi:hypothetical protein
MVIGINPEGVDDGDWEQENPQTRIPMTTAAVSIDPAGADRIGPLGVLDAPAGTGEYEVGLADVLDWSSDGARITGFHGIGTGHDEGHVVDLAAGTLCAITAAGLGGASFSPDGRQLAVVDTGILAVLDVGPDAAVERPDDDFDIAGAIGTVWHQSGDRLAVLTDEAVFVYAMPAGERVCEVPAAPITDARSWDFGNGCAAAFDSSGHQIAVLTESAGRMVEVWRLTETPQQLWTLPAPGVRGMAFGDGDRSLTGWGPGCVRFWDAITGQQRNAYQQQDEDLAFHDDAGHPLAYPHGWAGDGVFPQDPAFAVPADDGQWRWLGAFPTGLVVCPAEDRPALWRSLSFVLDRRIAWPAAWAEETSLLELHADWTTALQSSRLPTELPAEFVRWRGEHVGDREVDRSAGVAVVDSRQVTFAGSSDRPGWQPPRTVEGATRAPGYYRARDIRIGDEITEAQLRSMVGRLAMIKWRDEVELLTLLDVGGDGETVKVTLGSLERWSESGEWHSGVISGVPLTDLRSVAEVDYLGHPNDGS